MYIILCIHKKKYYLHTYALESLRRQRNLGQTQGGLWRPIPYNPPRCCCCRHLPVESTPRASISACSFWRSDFCLGKKCTGDSFRWSRAASGKGCIYLYGTSVNNLDHWQTTNPSWKVQHFCLISSQKRTYIYKTHWCTHFQAIRFGTHLMHPPWLQPLHLLPFVVMWFCVIPRHLTSTTTK